MLLLPQIVTLGIPRKFFRSTGVDHAAFIEDVNEKISSRGFILRDGQVLTTQINPQIPEDLMIDPDWEGRNNDIPTRRPWDAPQREFFGLENPYQMGDEGEVYTWSHVTTQVALAYLKPDEYITALVHGIKDETYFECPCHFASVVYTTRHRLICMMCGATHVVLKEPIITSSQNSITTQDWIDLFDENGSRREEEVNLQVIDFHAVESAPKIWTTDQWEEAKRRFTFFTSSSPEEIAAAIRGTESDPSILAEVGFREVVLAPPPAYHLLGGPIDTDLVDNAGHALQDGVSLFLESYTNPDRLKNAVPQLFRAVELILKARLQQLQPQGLDDHPNNPKVLERLSSAGVSISQEERDEITRIRRLRNQLQHGTASFSHRPTLTACKNAIAFLDRFASQELGIWIRDAIPTESWQKLLTIPSIAATARMFTEKILTQFQDDPHAEVTACSQCQNHTMFRPHPRNGASCIYCGHVPVIDNFDMA